jgi:hypothetical protein
MDRSARPTASERLLSVAALFERFARGRSVTRSEVDGGEKSFTATHYGIEAPIVRLFSSRTRRRILSVLEVYRRCR